MLRMKITMYELLGLVKDGKAPKEIKYGNMKLKYNEGCEDYYLYYGTGLFEYKFGNCKNFLNDEVEIIEEPKKIEKITVREKTLGFPNGEWTARNMDKAFAIKINELIDKINSLKEK
jgi:hypothetical protein